MLTGTLTKRAKKFFERNAYFFRRQYAERYFLRPDQSRSGNRKGSRSGRGGPVVQLVRIPACHAGGREFESRPDRQQAP